MHISAKTNKPKVQFMGMTLTKTNSQNALYFQYLLIRYTVRHKLSITET